MMHNKITCKQILVNYINTNPGWHQKVDLYVIARDWTPETAGRELRKAEEEGLLKVSYYDSKYAKGLSQYASLNYQPIVKKLMPRFVEVDGQRRVIME